MTLKKGHAERLMTELEDLVAVAYKPGYVMRDRRGYALALFHEAAHSLVASEYHVHTLGIAVTPGCSGGISRLGDIPYGQSEQSRSLVNAKISIAGLCADALFCRTDFYNPLESWHDGYLCLASLERGCDFAECVFKQFNTDGRSGVPVNSKSDLRRAMSSALHSVLSQCRPGECEPLMEKQAAHSQMIKLTNEGIVWTLQNLDRLKFLVAEFAKKRRNAGAHPFDPTPLIKKSQRIALLPADQRW